MFCPNPACANETFKVRVARKQIIKEIPMLPVELTCAKCGRRIKAWIINDQLKEIYGNLVALAEGQKMIFEELERIVPESKERKGFFESLKERFNK